MKKNIGNDKVIRAMAIGISAMLAASTPLTALAAEGEGEGEGEGGALQEQKATEETSVTATADAIDNAQNTITNDQNGSNVVLDDSMTLPSTGETIEVVPDAVEAASSANLADVKTNVGEGDEVAEINYNDDVKGKLLDANTGAITELENAEDALSDVSEAEATAKTDAKEAEDIIEEINANNQIVTDATEDAEDATAKAAEALEEAQNATTEAAAQAAVDKAAEAFGEAEEAQKKAQAAYDENVDKLKAAEDALELAEGALKKAQDAKDVTAAELKAAKDAVDLATANAEALKAQVDADAEALNKTKEATLKAAYDEMMTLQVYRNYNGAAVDGTDADGDGIGDEFVDEFGTESAEGAYWTAADKYFALYLEYVYGEDYVSGKWDRKNTLDNGWAYNSARDNTYTVTYKDANGEEKTAIYNYHTAEDGNITVYEKEIATGWTEAVTEVVQEEREREVTENVNALSIKNTDEEGNVTYIKLSDVKKDTDIVVPVSTDEEDNATSVLVKDENSQLLDIDEEKLNKNQEKIDETCSDTYTYGTIDIPIYGEKEVRVDYTDRLGSYDNLVKQVNEFESKYSADAGYRIEIVFDHGFGWDEVITLEEAKEMELGSELGSWLDCGFEVKVYQTVEDKDNILGYNTQQVIVKTTTADVVTTTENTVSGTCGNQKKAKKEAEDKVKELGLKEGEYSISYDYVLGGLFDIDCKYTITYYTKTTSKEVVKTEKYSATAYEMNSIPTTTTEKYFADVEKVIEPSVEYKYWTERKNTSNDKKILAAIKDAEEKLAAMLAKQDAAAIALAAAKQAQADVEKAQAELDKLEIDDSAYRTAYNNLGLAKKEYEKAATDLEKINADAKKAQQDYKDAAKELGRFVPTTPGGDASEGGAGTVGGGTPIVVNAALEEEIEVITVNATPVAGEAEEENDDELVVIDDEETPLSGTLEETEADSQDEENKEVIIEDEETPLASFADESKMSWWWLLIVLLLGTTGYGMYRKYQEKKAAAETNEEE